MGIEWIVVVDEVLSEGVLPEELPTEVAPASDVDEVNRLLRRRRALISKQTQLDDVQRAEIQRINEWHAEESAKITSAKSFIDRALDGWARAMKRLDGTKTHRLPHGVLRLRPPKPSVVDLEIVVDGERTAERLAHSGFEAFVRWKPEVDKKEIQAKLERGIAVGSNEAEGFTDYEVRRKDIDQTSGEVIYMVLPGVVFRVPNDDTFTVQQ